MTIHAAAQIWLDKLVYEEHDEVHGFVRMHGGDALPDPVIVFAGPTSGDVEAVRLRPSGIPGVLETVEPVPVALAHAGSVGALDGTLSLAPGELFVALFSAVGPEELRSRAANRPDGSLVCAVGLMRDASPADALTRIMPEIAMSDDERQVPTGGKPLGTLAGEGGTPVQLPLDELVFAPRGREELDDFVRLTGARVVDEMQYPPASQNIPDAAPTTAYLMHIDSQRAPKGTLSQLRRLYGEQHVLLASNPAVLDLYALVLQYRAQGFAVTVNPRVQFMSPVRTLDGKSDAPINAMSLDSGLPTLSDPRFGVQKAWAFLALWDADTRVVPAAFLDMGFAPNWDFRGYPDDIPQRDIETSASGPGAAVGVPRVGNSFFGAKTWHGNGVVTTAAGVLNNGWGGAGTGGQVLKPMLYEMGLHSYAFEMGKGIQLAVDDGATVVNISAGYPCRIVSDIGIGFSVCGPGDRALFCTAVTAALFAAASLAAAAAAAFIPIIGPAVAAALLTAAVAVSTACYATVLMGDPRGPLQAGVQYAVERGVTVVSISGNKQTEETLGLLCRVISCGAQDVSEWEIIPGTLPNVVCVAAAGATDPYPNIEYFGDRVDVWAPIGGAYFHPPTNDAVTGADDQVRSDGFSGTSAAAPYVSGIVAMMQAVNPRLDPRTAGLSSEERAAIPGRIAAILRDTATPGASLPTTPASDDIARRKRLVNAYAAVREAARGVVPEFEMLGYDVSLGLDEQVIEDTKDTPTIVSATDTVTHRGTILYLPSGGPPGGSAYVDKDWYACATPGDTTDVFTGGRIVLRALGGPSTFLTLEAVRGKLRNVSETVSPDGAERIAAYEVPPLFAGVRFIVCVSGIVGSDGLYKITFEPAMRVPGPEPDRFDRPAENPPERPDNNVPARAVPLGAGGVVAWSDISGPFELGRSWEVRIPDLNLHVLSDQDWFVLTMPADVATWDSRCPPELVVSLEPDDMAEGAEVELHDKDGVILMHGIGGASVSLGAAVQARFPLRFVVRSAGIGPVRYTLVVSLSEIKTELCKYLRERRVPVRHFPDFGRFEVLPKGYDEPGRVDPLDDPVPFDRRKVHRAFDGEGLLVLWRGGGLRLDTVTPGGSSVSAVLEDAEGHVIAQGMPVAMPQGAHAPQWSALEASDLPAAPYVVRFVDVQKPVDVHVRMSRLGENAEPVRSIRDVVNGSPGLARAGWPFR